MLNHFHLHPIRISGDYGILDGRVIDNLYIQWGDSLHWIQYGDTQHNLNLGIPAEMKINIFDYELHTWIIYY